MANAIEYDIYGLKCDNPKCDWQDMSIQLEDYPQHVGDSCPKCGECVLTEADFAAVKKLLGVIEITNTLFDNSETDVISEDDVGHLNLDLDGSGVFKIKGE